jgi:hypothetical protein
MPEESTTPPNQPTPRRRTEPEESGGSGKVLAIILGLAVLGLAFALFKSKSGVAAQEEKLTSEIATQKSNVVEYSTRLSMETNKALVVQSNLQALLDRRTAELASSSNRLVQTRQQLERAEAESYTTRNELASKITALSAAEAQRDEFQRQAAAIPHLEREVAMQKEKFNMKLLELANSQETLSLVRTEKADLERKLQDPLFLRRQATRVEQAAVQRQRTAANQPSKLADPRVLLDLQPDGTVRPAVATSTPKNYAPERGPQSNWTAGTQSNWTAGILPASLSQKSEATREACWKPALPVARLLPERRSVCGPTGHAPHAAQFGFAPPSSTGEPFTGLSVESLRRLSCPRRKLSGGA